MSNETTLLDDFDAVGRPATKLPPKVVYGEFYLYPAIFIIQYLLLLIGEGGWIVAALLHFGIGVIQLLSGFFTWAYLRDARRALYWKIVAAWFLIEGALWISMDWNGGLMGGILVGVHTFAVSHLIAWFYWNIARKDTQTLRESNL